MNKINKSNKQKKIIIIIHVFQNTPKREKHSFEISPLLQNEGSCNQEKDCHLQGTACDYPPYPPSVQSNGSVDGKDAELHSPVNSPHSSTSGNISDLSDSSFNMTDFITEKTVIQPRMPLKVVEQAEGQSHGQMGDIQNPTETTGFFSDAAECPQRLACNVQGQSKGQSLGQVVPNGNHCEDKVDRPNASHKTSLNFEDMKENINPAEQEIHSSEVQEEYEDISPPQSHLSADSNISTTSSQRVEASAKPAETYISQIAKVYLTFKF